MYGLAVTWLHRKAVPPTKLFYPSETVDDPDNPGETIEKHEADAFSMLQRAKDYVAWAFSQLMVQKADGGVDLIRDWDVEELPQADRTDVFIKFLTHFENLAFMGMLIPEKTIRQEQAVGSYALSQTQRDMFIMTEEQYLADYEDALRRWVIRPMLALNFSQPGADFSLGPLADETLGVELELISEAVRLSGEPSWLIDWESLCDKHGLPLKPAAERPSKPQAPTPGEEAGEKTETEAVYFQGRPRERVPKKVREYAAKYTALIGKKLDSLTARAVKDVTAALEKEGAVLALSIEREFKKGVPSKLKLEELVQVSRTAFRRVLPFVLEGWRIGASAASRQGKFGTPPADPDAQSKREMAKRVLYYAGSKHIAGQPEQMERRLYAALVDLEAPDGKEARRRVLDTFEAYAGNVLKTTVAHLIHEASLIGTKAVIEMNRRAAIKAKAGR
jgi:hypothetical protein